ncbi:MAG: hypothetical protein LBN93_05790 [Candidatus Symbiothrix sp.]|jgi:hypothetical protein|nr:hypothetical protein [Candidatus Symbiothrix sp.]
MKNYCFSFLLLFVLVASCGQTKTNEKIDRKAVVARHCPHVTAFDSLSSLSVGNGNFCFTADVTGLQSFPELYAAGMPLGTQSQWGWHSFPNVNKYQLEETLKVYDFGHGHKELYATQFNEKGRQQAAADYFRSNPHRLHLGIVGLEMVDSKGNLVRPEGITGINQRLNVWGGVLDSRFLADGVSVSVQTVANSERDAVAAKVVSPLIKSGRLSVKFHFPYPTGAHTDDACNWNLPEKHQTKLIEQGEHYALFQRMLDQTVYYVRVDWTGGAKITEKAPHYFLLTPEDNDFSFSATFAENKPETGDSFEQTVAKSTCYWEQFWTNGGFVDFSACKDERAAELERRVILSQYLMAIQCAGAVPPQETGLTYNSWFGKFHLEMHWWHAVHFALWNRTELMERSLDWYASVEPVAKDIAQRQGFDGIRWMKMTDPSGLEAPSKVGSFLIWQQPHFIYMAELVYRKKHSPEVVEKYKDLVFKTAEFMASFATYDAPNHRYVLKGVIPAQETLRASETVNPPFELSYWHYALSVAQLWRERAGMTREPKWEEIINQLSPLASANGLYLAAETALDTYTDIRFTSDHPAVLGALGILPESRLLQKDIMTNTMDWIWDNWNWDKTWGWDFPMVAMCAARLGQPERAVGALLMDKRTNTCLVNGHNYQDNRLRVYLPGNGGLLTTVAMMCAGWDGNTTNTPGFPKDGNWDVKWEDLLPMP